jgi:four helix bundle protein
MEEDLKIRTKLFAIGIIRFCKSLKKDYISQVLGKQLLRSGTSVGANTRSAFRGRSNKEFIAKVGIVIEEADECVYWLELIQETIEHDNTTIQSLIKEADELVAIFVSISKKNKR